MIQSYLKRTFFITLILISIQNSNQIIEATVQKIQLDSYPCSKSKAQYDFDIIISSFSDSVSSFDTITFDVQTSDGKKLQTNCSPYSFLSSKFTCHIDVRYALDKADILLPTNAPTVDKYAFKNWEQTIGANPGVSNKIGDVTCLPEEKNTFIPSSVTVEDCFLGSRSFKINGEWEQKDKADLVDYSSAKIELDNKNRDIATCKYRTDFNGFDCNFEGEGDLNMKDQYFTTLSKVYKMKGFNSGKSAKKCDDDDDDYIIRHLSADYLHFLNKILIFMSLLLF